MNHSDSFYNIILQFQIQKNHQKPSYTSSFTINLHYFPDNKRIKNLLRTSISIQINIREEKL